MADLNLWLSPTQSAFVMTEAHIAILKGPMGEGKTHAGIAALCAHAVRCGTDITAVLLRDTHTNIETSTISDILRILGEFVTLHNDNRVAIIHSTPKVKLHMFGIDDQASMSKMQGLQVAVIWLEEPAPIFEKANAGLPKSVFDFAIARAARQQGTTLRVQITQNPADEEHWTEEVAAMPDVYFRDEETGVEIIKKVFNIPRGENKYLTDLARAANKAAFQHDEGLYARYVKGEAAPVRMGKQVCKGYNPEVHFAKNELDVVKGAMGIRCYDAWHHPVCVIGQWVPPGRFIIHEAIQDENIGIRELVTEQVIPRLNTKKYRGKITQWRDIGDPTMRTPDQSTVTQSTARVLEELMNTRYEPGPTRWDNRIQPVKTALLSMSSNGQPKIQLSCTAYNLHRALNGGWHWKTDNNGKIIGNVPVKDRYGDLGDAFTYGASVLFSESSRKSTGLKPKFDSRRIARTYGGRV